MKKQITIITLLLAILLATTAVTAETISLDPCGETTSYTAGTPTKLYLENNCLLVELRQNPYNPNIDFYDKVHNEPFRLHLMGIDERNLDNPAETLMTPFANLTLTGSINGNTILYTNGDTTIGYTLQGRELKASATLNNWNYVYANSDLWVETLYLSDAQGRITHLAPEVDGVTQPVTTEERVAGQNTFYYQRLGRGNVIVLDPVFTVDYSPVPATHLIFGNVLLEPESSFFNEIDITSGVSDNSTSTNYTVREHLTSLPSGYTLELYYRMDETLGTVAIDSSENFLDGTYNNTPDLTIAGIRNTGTNFNGSQYIYVPHQIPTIANDEKVGICFGMNTSGSFGAGGTERVFDFLGATGMWARSDTGEIRIGIDRTISGADDIKSSTQFNDDDWHRVCFFDNLGNTQIWVDGILDKQEADVAVGSIVFPPYQLIGVNDAFTEPFYGQLDEFCMVKGTNLVSTLVVAQYELDQSCDSYAPDDDQGIAISGRWNQTYDPVYQWYADVYKLDGNTTTNLYVQAYNNSDDPSGLTVNKTIAGEGWFSINVTSLIQYMNETLGLPYTQLRVWTSDEAELSELLLRKEVNHTEPPTIDACWVDTTTIGCLEHAHLDCNITDTVQVDQVLMQVNDVNQTATQHTDHWTYELSPTHDGTTVYEWQYTHASDIGGLGTTEPVNINITYTCNFDEYINITHTGTIDVDLTVANTTATINWTTSNPSDSLVDYGLTPSNLSESGYNGAEVTSHSITIIGLINDTTYYYNVTSTKNPSQTVGTFNFTTLSACTENWVEDAFTCNVTDQYFRTYTDQNSCGTTDDLPVDNGTTQICNYCSQDLEQTLGECTFLETQNVSWVDHNYSTCCAVTGLSSDCDILTYPFNQTTQQFCTFYTQDFNCTFDNTAVIDDKINLVCEMPTSDDYCCIVKKYQIVDTTETLLDVSPQYRNPTESLLPFWQQETETRSCFTPELRQLNAYYTNKELRGDVNYKIDVTCTSQNTTIKSEYLLTPTYHTPDEPFHLIVWGADNPEWVIVWIVAFLVVVGIIGYIFRNTLRHIFHR